MKIAITGSEGFIGWHLRCRLHALKTHKVVNIGRELASNPVAYAEALQGVDSVVHLAGVNRAEAEQVFNGNVEAASQLSKALAATEFKGHCVYSSSTQAGRDHPYGRGKQGAHEVLQQAATLGGWRHCTLVVPHVFGEHCKPNYNSAVATFAHGIVNDNRLEIVRDGQLELIYVGDLVERILATLAQGLVDIVRVSGLPATVGEIHDRMAALWACYSRDEIPDLSDRTQLVLFNTLRSYAFPKFYPRPYNLRSDPRGHLAEVVRAHQGGQIFFSSTNPGFTRGNHFHFKKVERFSVIDGNARIEIRRLLSSKIDTFDVTGDQPVYIDMPALHTHSITNTGSRPLLTLFWSNEFFDPAAPDTFPEVVRIQE